MQAPSLMRVFRRLAALSDRSLNRLLIGGALSWWSGSPWSASSTSRTGSCAIEGAVTAVVKIGPVPLPNLSPGQGQL